MTLSRRRRNPKRHGRPQADAGRADAGSHPRLPAREAFFANISHELRTPLNAILGFNRLARADLPQDVDRSHLDHIDEAARVMLRVVNDLLDLAQLEAGRLEINPDQPLALAAMFTRVGTLGAGLRQGKPIRLYTVVDADCPDALRGDTGRIEQVLINLLGNALKFTESGMVKLAARLRARHEGRVVLRLSVSDTGVGIEMSQLDRLGQPFERAAGGRGPSGTGLGLAVVRRLLELHGTELHVASVAGGGTIMWFDLELDVDAAAPVTALRSDTALLSFDPWLVKTVATQWRARGLALAEPAQAARWVIDLADPQAAQHEAAAQAQGRTVLRVSADPVPPRGGVIALPLLASQVFRECTKDPLATDQALQGLRVLVLEDNPLNQRVLLGFLTRLGVDSVLAADGRQALAALQGPAFDAALLDIQLPGESGLHTARQMRQLPQGRHLPLVFLSAHLSADDRLEAGDLGAMTCLCKPLDPAELQAVLHRLPRRLPPSSPPPSSPTPSSSPPPPSPRPELLALFSTQWSAQRALLREQTDAAVLLQTVHALRGSLGVLGARDALQLARALEESLRAGQPPSALQLAELRALGDRLTGA